MNGKKKQWGNYIIMAMLFMTLTVFFTACGEKKAVDSKNSMRSEYIYQPTYQGIATKIDYVQSFIVKEDRIYIYGSKWEEAEEKEGGEGKTYYYITSCNLDGSDLQETELKGLKKQEYIRTLCTDDQNRLILVTQEYEYNEETEEEKEHYRIRTINEKGKIRDTIELKNVKKNSEDYFYVESNNIAFLNGLIYVAMENKIYVFNEKGKLKETYEMDGEGYIQALIYSAEGKLYSYGWIGESGKYALSEIDVNKGAFGKSIDFGEYNLYSLSVRQGKGSEVFTNDGSNIYKIDLSSGKLSTELNWMNSDLDGDNIMGYFPLEDGKFLAILGVYDESKQKNNIELVTLQRVKASEIKEKKVLIYAGASMDYSVKAKILDFNKTNENYRIEVRDYSGYEDATTRLSLDIAAGKIPDILDVSYGVSKDPLIKKGLFLDLYSLMETDKEIKKEDFLSSVLNTMETEGKLYFLPYNFSIMGLLGGKKNVGDIEGWTVEEMMELYEAMPEGSIFMEYMSRESLLYLMLSGQLGEYVNWNTGEVKFDTDNFIKLVEFTENFPSEEEEGLYDEDVEMLKREGKVFLAQVNLYDPPEIMYYKEQYKKQNGYNILSYPSSDKNNKLIMNGLGSMLAITKQCKEKEGAWEFIRQFLTYEYQKDSISYGFPIRKDILEKKLEYAQATEPYTDDDGTEIKPITSEYGYERALSKEEVDKIRSAIDRVGACRSYDMASNDIYEIVNEELKTFYAGDKTAKEAAEVIQSRVKIYVSENS